MPYRGPDQVSITLAPRRPERPDADLLASAAVLLQRLLALRKVPSWSVQRDERARSTHFVFEAGPGSGIRTLAHLMLDTR